MANGKRWWFVAWVRGSGRARAWGRRRKEEERREERVGVRGECSCVYVVKQGGKKKKGEKTGIKKERFFFSISFISFLYLFFSFIFFSCEHSGDISRSGEGGKGNKTEFIAMQEIMWGTKRQFV